MTAVSIKVALTHRPKGPFGVDWEQCWISDQESKEKTNALQKTVRSVIQLQLEIRYRNSEGTMDHDRAIAYGAMALAAFA